MFAVAIEHFQTQLQTAQLRYPIRWHCLFFNYPQRMQRAQRERIAILLLSIVLVSAKLEIL